MAKILINDVLDELRDENKRLLHQNNMIYDLLNKYRLFSLNLQKLCVCGQKSNNSEEIQTLEDQYREIYNQKMNIIVKCERIGENEDNCLPNKSIDFELNLVSNQRKKSKPKRVSKKRQKSESNEFESDFDANEDDLSDSSVKEKKKRPYVRRKPKGETKEPVCDYVGCGLTFKSWSHMEVHIRRRHTFIRPFKCEECDKSFYTKIELQSHQMTHSSRKPFHCQPCDKYFTRVHSLLEHKEVHHSDKAVVYKCDLCEFQTKYRSHLPSHIKRVHTVSNQSFECDVEDCHKVFKSLALMKRHKSYFHSNRNFVCDWPGCGHGFKAKWTLDEHMRTHLGIRQFKCPYDGCGKSFIMAKTLSQHKMFHTKKFVCSWPECGQRFGLRTLLVAHQNKHQNIKPFKCGFSGCHKDFYDSSHLNLHIRTTHKND